MTADSAIPIAGTQRVGARLTQGRDAALDFTKGALVVSMIAYHSINYLFADKDWLRYLHFVPGSFIFITGFLVTRVYWSRAVAGETRVYARLLVRGLKLAGIFLLLNLLAHAFVTTNYNRAELGIEVFWFNIGGVLLSGDQRIAVFEILLPISYLLLVAGPLLRLERSLKYALPISAAAGLVACVVAELRGHLPINADLLSIGLCGVIAGMIPVAVLSAVARRVLLVAVAYGLYVTAVAFFYPSYLMNLAGVPLTLLFMYAVGMRVPARTFTHEWIAMLGKYSLIGYIAQIAVLQVIFRVFRGTGFGDGLLPLGFCITLLLISVMCLVIERSRGRYRVVSAAYEAAFA